MDTATNDQKLQQDIAARLSTDAVLAPIGVVLEMDGQTESEISLALGPARAGGIAGKQRGSLIVVQQTEDGGDNLPNVPGPFQAYRITVRVLELPKLAREQPGYVSQFVVAARIKALLHLCQLGTAPVIFVRGVPSNDGEGTVGKDLTFTWQPGPEFVQSVAQPTLTEGPPGQLAIASATPGATCYATTDGSYPAPIGEPALALQPQPPAGTLVRAVAYLAGAIPSGVTERQF